MNFVERTSRNPNYRNDIEYGKAAELDFEKLYKKSFEDKGYTFFDVRTDKQYQEIDVDYVIDKLGRLSLPPIKDVVRDDNFKKVEVKLDSRGIDTGNFPYEVVSHSSSGWCVTTKCDLVYLTLTERDKTSIVRRCWIDMKKWHDYCANRKNVKKASYIKSENVIVDLLCNMYDMEKKGILKWVNEKTEAVSVNSTSTSRQTRQQTD